MATENYEIERNKEKKADKLFFAGAVVFLVIAVVLTCSGCEQLKEHQSDLNQWIIEWLQGKGNESGVGE